MKVSPKPVVVEAVQWFPGVDIPGVTPIGADAAGGALYGFGGMAIKPGDFVVEGERVPVTEADLAAGWDVVDERAVSK